jgi:hypothetical protein
MQRQIIGLQETPRVRGERREVGHLLLIYCADVRQSHHSLHLERYPTKQNLVHINSTVECNAPLYQLDG